MSDTAETKKEPEKRVKVLMVFMCHERGRSSRDLLQAWKVVTEQEYADGDRIDDDYAHARAFVSLVKKPSAGAVYDGEMSEDGKSVYTTSMRYRGVWKNDEQRAEWYAANRATMDNYDAEKREKKDAGENPIYDLMVPLKRMYDKQIGPARHLFLARVISFLTGKGKIP